MRGLLLVVFIVGGSFSFANGKSEFPNFQSSKPSFVLTKEDQEILKKGRVSKASAIGGAVVGSLVGFGSGHAIQDRYQDNGWYYTVAELSFLSLVLLGSEESKDNSSVFNIDSSNNSHLAHGIGAVGLFLTRVFQIVDVWYAPSRINKKYESILKKKNPKAQWLIYPKDRGLNASVSFSF